MAFVGEGSRRPTVCHAIRSIGGHLRVMNLKEFLGREPFIRRGRLSKRLHAANTMQTVAIIIRGKCIVTEWSYPRDVDRIWSDGCKWVLRYLQKHPAEESWEFWKVEIPPSPPLKYFQSRLGSKWFRTLSRLRTYTSSNPKYVANTFSGGWSKTLEIQILFWIAIEMCDPGKGCDRSEKYGRAHFYLMTESLNNSEASKKRRTVS